MKLAERLELIRAGYKKKEIDALEESEKAEIEIHEEEQADYKSMYEQALQANEELKKSISENETKIKEIQAENRQEGLPEEPPHNFIDDIFNQDEEGRN